MPTQSLNTWVADDDGHGGDHATKVQRQNIAAP